MSGKLICIAYSDLSLLYGLNSSSLLAQAFPARRAFSIGEPSEGSRPGCLRLLAALRGRFRQLVRGAGRPAALRGRGRL